MTSWWRLHEWEVWWELRLLLMLLRRHVREVGMSRHAAIRRWLLVLGLSELSALLLFAHLLLHKDGVLLIEAWWRHAL